MRSTFGSSYVFGIAHLIASVPLAVILLTADAVWLVWWPIMALIIGILIVRQERSKITRLHQTVVFHLLWWETP